MNKDIKVKLGAVELGFGTNTNQNGMSVDIFFAGCSMSPKCDGCQNPELWNPDAGFEMTVEQLKYYIKASMVDAIVKNVVFVGGEPLDQQKAVYVLAKWAKEEYGLKTWLYTGHEYKQVPVNIKNTLDVIVSGRYDKDKLAEPGAFPASTNQEVHYGRN